MILSDSRQFPAPKTAPLRPRPPIPTGLPRYPEHLSDVPSPIPRRAKLGGQMVSSAQLPQPSPFCRRVGALVFTFEACSAFTHVMARTDRSTAQGGLYHGASVQPVTRSNCPLATGSNHQVSRWVLPPLAFRALVAHYRKKVARPHFYVQSHPRQSTKPAETLAFLGLFVRIRPRLTAAIQRAGMGR